MDITDLPWLGVVLAIASALAWMNWPLPDEKELRKDIGAEVIDEAVEKAKRAVPLDAEREKSFRERFWERLNQLFR